MSLETTIALLATLISTITGLFTSKLIFKKKKFTPQNGTELLKLGKPEQWNELRIKNPNWLPDLTGLVIKNLDLRNCDFREAKLNNSFFESTCLEGCRFDKASLKNCSFKNCNLTDSTFIESDLTNATFENSTLERIELRSANTNYSIGLENIKTEAYKTNKIVMEIVKSDFENIDELSPAEFEELVADIFKSYGYNVQLTPPYRDGGVDIFLTKKDILGDINMIVEVKKYDSNRAIGISVLRSLLGAMYNNRVNKGILVTSSHLSLQAKRFEESSRDISVIDREKLKEMIDKLDKNFD